MNLYDALVRLRAVLQVVDEDLTGLDASLATPVPASGLTAAQWKSVEAARLAVEESLGLLEERNSCSAALARDWQAKALLAATAGRLELAEQARLLAAQAEADRTLYEQEIVEVHRFLQHWATHVTPGSAE